MLKIFIDAGHGGSDPGAVYGSFVEKDLNLKVAKFIYAHLMKYECTLEMSRMTDVYIAPQTRMDRAAASKADLSLSVHHNAAGGDGCEIYYWHSDAKAKEFATILNAEFIKTGQNSRGIKPSKKAAGYHNFGMCRVPAASGVPAVLAEYAFIDNTHLFA